MNIAIATQHRDRMYRLIESAASTVSVRPPATRVTSTNAAEKIFGGTGGTEADYGTPVEVQAWVHVGMVPGDFTSQYKLQGAPVGILAESDIILSLKISDVLLDSAKPFGRTLFDTAKDVVVQGSIFEVKGTFRSGLAPLTPYILWVGLVNAGE